MFSGHELTAASVKKPSVHVANNFISIKICFSPQTRSIVGCSRYQIHIQDDFASGTDCLLAHAETTAKTSSYPILLREKALLCAEKEICIVIDSTFGFCGIKI